MLLYIYICPPTVAVQEPPVALGSHPQQQRATPIAKRQYTRSWSLAPALRCLSLLLARVYGAKLQPPHRRSLRPTRVPALLFAAGGAAASICVRLRGALLAFRLT